MLIMSLSDRSREAVMRVENSRTGGALRSFRKKKKKPPITLKRMTMRENAFTSSVLLGDSWMSLLCRKQAVLGTENGSSRHALCQDVLGK